MTVSNLENLIDKLYKDGIDKVKKESENLVLDSKKEAEKIIEDANEKAKKIIEKAENDADTMKSRAKADMERVFQEILLSTKEKLTEIIDNKLFKKEDTKKLLSKNEFIEEVILNLTKQDLKDMNIVFSEAYKEQIKSFMVEELKNIGNKKDLIKFSSDDFIGFRLEETKGMYKIIFDKDTLVNLFREKFRPFIKDLLFEDKT